MTLSKAQIARRVQEQVTFKKLARGRQLWLFPEMNRRHLSRKRAGQIVDALFEILKSALARGEDVQIRGFGRFRVSFQWARKGRNPQTGEMIMLRSRRRVCFRPSRSWKDRLQ